MIRGQRRADMGKKHDKHHERQIYNGGTRVYEKAFLEILNKLGFQDKMAAAERIRSKESEPGYGVAFGRKACQGQREAPEIISVRTGIGCEMSLPTFGILRPKVTRSDSSS